MTAGYALMNLGDQLTDLDRNPHVAISVKLPNPFDYLP